jgi:hypothetical protein
MHANRCQFRKQSRRIRRQLYCQERQEGVYMVYCWQARLVSVELEAKINTIVVIHVYSQYCSMQTVKHLYGQCNTKVELCSMGSIVCKW